MNDEAQALKSVSRMGMVWGILTILIGFFAMASPLVTGLAVSMLVAIALIAAGLSMTIYAFQAPSLGRGVLKFLFGGLTVLVGIAMLAQPGLALAKLTLLLGAYFIADGFMTLALAWNVKPERGWGWMTFNGAVTIALAWMILRGWPVSGAWAIGILVGVLTIIVRVTNPSYYEGVIFAILLACVFSPLFDYFVVERNIKRRRKRLEAAP